MLKNMKTAAYYEKHDILKEIKDEPVEMSLETELRASILSGKRKVKLKNISVKIDPLQIRAIKKIAAMKAIPYQTLIRHWLSQYIKRELHI
jgi:predicted DNA binding CopG/RHH family protein